MFRGLVRMSVTTGIDEMTCANVISQLHTLADEEIAQHVLKPARICHFKPAELATLSSRLPTKALKAEILTRRQAPARATTLRNPDVWTIESLEKLARAFPDDKDIMELVTSKINQADDKWFLSAHAETLTSLLHSLPDKTRILRELSTRRYSLTSSTLASIIKANN
jgi:hypothetical protein